MTTDPFPPRAPTRRSPAAWAGLPIVTVALVLGLAASPACASDGPLEVLRRPGKGPPTVVLLHGFGSSASEWMPLADEIPLPDNARLLFPNGPERGPGRGRAWWDLDLAGNRRSGAPGVDLRRLRTSGLDHAAKLVRRSLTAEGNSRAAPFVLGGFSQGAMVSCHVAFTTDTPLGALVILSGTPIDTAGWRKGMAARKRLPVFMAHGRRDNILPFDLAEQLRAALVQAGLDVTFHPFEGGHAVPDEVAQALGTFLQTLASRPR